MLTQDGKLTSIGSWYMGGNATNNIPMKSSASSSRKSFLAPLLNHYNWTCFLFPLAMFSLLC